MLSCHAKSQSKDSQFLIKSNRFCFLINLLPNTNKLVKANQRSYTVKDMDYCHSMTGTVGLSLTWGINEYVFVCIVPCWYGPCNSQSLIKGILPDVHKQDPKTCKTADHGPHRPVALSTDRDTILNRIC